MLANLLDAELDEQRLALHLLNSSALHPLADQPVWRGVRSLPTDHYLVLDDEGQPRLVKWWSPPEPLVPLTEGAAALREALAECAGPLRQVTPLAPDCAPDAPVAISQLLAAVPALMPSRN